HVSTPLMPALFRACSVHASLLEECATPGDIATVHTIIPIHATHVPVDDCSMRAILLHSSSFSRK
ncbi:hypothetical protein L9F63_023977, partial [Diploptera punctata]